MIERSVASIVAAALRLPWLTIVLGMALTAGAVTYITSHFAITTDTSQLISSELDWRQREQQFDAAFPQHSDTIEIVIDEGFEGARMAVESSGPRPVAAPRPQAASKARQKTEKTGMALDVDMDFPRTRSATGAIG